MNEEINLTEGPGDRSSTGEATGFRPLPMAAPDNEPCCGPPPSPPSGPFEKPGYKLWSFVQDFVATPAGTAPQVSAEWKWPDRLGAFAARISGFRNDYKIAPGLYAVGSPGPESAVLVSANYKLTFDALRRQLSGLDLWLLILDTRGINVWCSAGKGVFSTEEVIRMVRLTGLGQVVSHRRLILPQLSATGVSAYRVKRACGFEVVWGPIRAKDIKSFFEAGLKVDPSMRVVRFGLWDRLVLTPIELTQVIKPALLALLTIFIISGVGPQIFSFGQAWSHGLMAALSLVAAVLTGAWVAPVLLPWIPGRSFSIKGALTGLIGPALVLSAFWGGYEWMQGLALVLLGVAISSYLTMNFTGSTPFTSPSGVEKEMRRALPLQALVLLAAVVLWIAAPFVG